jgi:hypothetical protein
MMLLSLILGVFISYYFIFVNGLFIKEIGAKNLCYAFLLSGIFGYLVTYIYNNVEKRIGFFKTATYFNFFFVLSIGLALFFYVKKIHIDVVIFIAYTWFWLSSNYLNLVFWKIPSMYFDIGENKQYNGWISTGEVISSIVAYLSVYYLKIKGINLLIFSFSGMIGFFIIFLISFFMLIYMVLDFLFGFSVRASLKNCSRFEKIKDYDFLSDIFDQVKTRFSEKSVVLYINKWKDIYHNKRKY